MHELKLKIIVHSGEALFHSIADVSDVSGVDVILAHRLLKNSVDADEYILMTAPAYRDLRFPSELEVHESSEEYEGFGSIATFVHYPDGAFEEVAPGTFLRATPSQILTTTLGGGLREVQGQFKTLVRGRAARFALRNFPMNERGLARSILAGLMLLLVDADSAAAISAIGQPARDDSAAPTLGG